VYLPGDYIARRGELANSMFFVSKGELAVLVPTPGTSDLAKAMQIHTIQRGDHFGEIALFGQFGGGTRTAWVRAEGYALVSALTRNMIEVIWTYFPNEKAELQEMVNQQLEKDRQRAVQGHWRDGMDAIKKGLYNEPEGEEAMDKFESDALTKMGDAMRQSNLGGMRSSGVRQYMPTKTPFSGTGGGPLAGASSPTSKGRHASLLQNNGNSSEERLLHTVRAMISRMESLTDDLNDMQGKMSTIESRITGQVGLPKFDFVPALNPPPAHQKQKSKKELIYCGNKVKPPEPHHKSLVRDSECMQKGFGASCSSSRCCCTQFTSFFLVATHTIAHSRRRERWQSQAHSRK